MDLNAAKLANGKASRLTRLSLIVCFVLASGMLLASLATAQSMKSQSTAQSLSTSSLPH